jgi:hypothetical protein
MKKTFQIFFGACLAALLWPQSGLAQSQFQVRAQQGTIIQNLADGSTLNFQSEGIGQAVNAVVTVTYRGTQTAIIGSYELTGTTDFSVTTSPVLPVTLNPGESMSFLIAFSPTSLARLPGRLVIAFTEGPRTTGSFTINLLGVTPDFGFSFIPPRGSQNSISSGGTIAFPDTAINQTSAATFIISNRGTGPGTVQNIALSGAQYTIGGVPLLPAVVPAGQEVRTTITFAPLQSGASPGSVRVDFLNGTSATFNLTGTGTGSSWAYELVSGSTTRPLAPNDTITMPQTNLTEKSALTVRVRNTGNADGVVARIAVAGAAEITLIDVPFLPVSLTPGGSLSFSVQFAPVQQGTFTSRLRVDDAFFNVSGVGLGSSLTYAFVVGAATTTVVNNGTVIVPPAAVGSTSSARFQIQNTGNAPTFVTSITLPGTSVFTLSGVPPLPARLGGGETVSFTVNFTPTVTGSATASLKVDAQTFTVSSVGNDPPALPSVTFPGVTPTADAAQLVTAGVTLASPYPVNLTGKLILTFASDFFADDPAIQFAQGGRLLPFVIPAGSTRALFGVNTTDVRLQTGTVAGVITLAATFATEAGNINLSPTVVPATTITVRPGPPRIRSVQLSAKTATSFTILVTGYATTRNVTTMAFTFTQATDPDKKDLKLETTSLNLPVDGPFAAWFTSTAAAPFGGQFTATITFNVRGDIDAILSTGVTASNAQGASNSSSVNLR